MCTYIYIYTNATLYTLEINTCDEDCFVVGAHQHSITMHIRGLVYYPSRVGERKELCLGETKI